MQGPWQSSGDLLADRRFSFARELLARDDHAAAAELLEQALERAPDFAAAWFALGEAREKLDARAGAIDAFRRALASDTLDRLGAGVRLARLGERAIDGAMSPAYVTALFDQYAPAFDRALTQGLAYRAPALLWEAIASSLPSRQAFGAALDLGCGTGLMGAVLRPHAGRLTGVDLSPRMIAEAGRKELYDRLEVGDIGAFLERETAQYDLVTAADVFVYLPDLTPIVTGAARRLARAGLLAFTVETHAGAGVVLGEHLRYAHGEAHARAALAAAGLTLLLLAAASTRNEGAVPVPGLIVLARR